MANAGRSLTFAETVTKRHRPESAQTAFGLDARDALGQKDPMKFLDQCKIDLYPLR